MFKLVPILIGLASGYLLCVILTVSGVPIIDFTPITAAPWFNIPYVTAGFMSLPKFNLSAILIIAPVAIVTFMEHIGDVNSNSIVCGKDFLKDPGLHRTVLGDGLASVAAGFFGGPANTTYSENTGVLAATKNYDPRLLRLTAVFAIFLAFFGKFGAFLQTIPAPVKGGIEIILFGMIVAVGLRNLIESKTDMSSTRNVIIVGLILISGVGISIASYIGGSVTGIALTKDFSLSPLFVATILGITANLVLREPKNKEAPLTAKQQTTEPDIKPEPQSEPPKAKPQKQSKEKPNKKKTE